MTDHASLPDAINDALAWQTVHARAVECVARVAPPGDIDPANVAEYLEAVTFLIDATQGYRRALERLVTKNQ